MVRVGGETDDGRMGEEDRGDGIAGRYIWGGGGGDANASRPNGHAGGGNTVNIFFSESGSLASTVGIEEEWNGGKSLD